jgi:formate hydrogenlyase transcriptional activator
MREILEREQMVSYCILPLTTAQHRLGCLGFGHGVKHDYSDAEIEFMRQVARQVAVAVDNALNYDKADRYQKQLAEERDHLRVLLEVNNAIQRGRDISGRKWKFRLKRRSLEFVFPGESRCCWPRRIS